MEQYKKEFIEFMIDCNVLKFGDFVTKSGRKTPFFVNTGFYRTGSQLKRLGEYYAQAIHDHFGFDFDVLFGPAYKGIPLSVAATIAISEKYDKDIRYCSNRKEVKDHGDKGILLGSPIQDGDKVIIIEDVTTAGTSIQETLPIIKAQGDVEVGGLVVSVDRMERGQGEKSHPFLFYLYLSVITVARFPFLHGERGPIALFSFGQIDKFLQSYYKGKKPFLATPFALFMLPRPRPAAAP